jgi:hypothetical protein
MKAFVSEMEHQYEKRRKQLVSSSCLDSVRDCELVCCFSKYDVYHKVILRQNPHVKLQDFLKAWDK